MDTQIVAVFCSYGDLLKALFATCDNYHIPRSKSYRGEVWRGCQSSKKRYFSKPRSAILITYFGQKQTRVKQLLAGGYSAIQLSILDISCSYSVSDSGYSPSAKIIHRDNIDSRIAITLKDEAEGEFSP